MTQLLNSFQKTLLLHDSTSYDWRLNATLSFRRRRCSYYGHFTRTKRFQSRRLSPACVKLLGSKEKCSTQPEAEVEKRDALNAYTHVQTLRRFPKEELVGKVVLVRFDSAVLSSEECNFSNSFERSLSTIKYLYHSGAKIVIAGDWNKPGDTMRLLLPEKAVADYLSSALQLKVVPTNWISDRPKFWTEEFGRANILLVENLSMFKEERANSLEFARVLSSGVDIFVNDNFSQSHKILASTVGVPCYCYASVAGFHFEEKLNLVMEATMSCKRPYVAIIGGGNLNEKAAAVHYLASKCDGMFFVGMMAFQMMHALGIPVPLHFVEHGATEEASKIIQLAKERSIPILIPKDYLCVNDLLPEQVGRFAAHKIEDGWTPIDLGPISLNEISSFLSKCKKILWIGPVKFKSSKRNVEGAAKLAFMLEALSQSGCDVIVVGTNACQEIMRTSGSFINYSLCENASVMWRFLKGIMLPGHAALDRAYPFEINWAGIFHNPTQPLLVDIGSGNGLFLFKMAGMQKDMNFLGLEINRKLVKRCLDSAGQYGLKNGHFIATNATSTFRSIVSSYPGELVLVSIQCPNPDFNKPEYRWRMLQRPLVEAIADLLSTGGKVFLQSDVEPVAVRMKEQFMMYGKGKLVFLKNENKHNFASEEWLEENPFGIRSDWEQQVINRGASMYRMMFSKVIGANDK